MNAVFLGLRIKETKEVYEGEVTELTPVETENPLGGWYIYARNCCLMLLCNKLFIAPQSNSQSIGINPGGATPSSLW